MKYIQSELPLAKAIRLQNQTLSELNDSISVLEAARIEVVKLHIDICRRLAELKTQREHKYTQLPLFEQFKEGVW